MDPTKCLSIFMQKHSDPIKYTELLWWRFKVIVQVLSAALNVNKKGLAKIGYPFNLIGTP